MPFEFLMPYDFTDVIWLKYCRCGVKYYSINQSINLMTLKNILLSVE